MFVFPLSVPFSILFLKIDILCCGLIQPQANFVNLLIILKSYSNVDSINGVGAMLEHKCLKFKRNKEIFLNLS